jgi:predicted oxidoreductase
VADRNGNSRAYDVVVVGAGIAGLVTALELLDRGRDVLLLDRCEPQELGGLAREAFGGLFVVDSPEQRRGGIRDSYELALDDWVRTADFDAGDEWPRRWAEQYVRIANEEIRDWLRRRKIAVFPVVNWAERGVFADGNSVPRFHLAWGTGKRLVDAVWQAIEEHPRRRALELRFRNRVTKLIEEDGAVAGVEGVDESRNDSGFEIRARAVVMASGGIGGNLDRVRKEWPRELGSPPEHMLMGSHYYADGAMHDEVERIGGNVTNLSRMWNYGDAVHHPRPRRPLHGLKLIPPRSGLFMDPTGKRYGPRPVIPTFDAHDALTTLARQDKNYGWLICNWKIAVRELDVSGSQHNPNIRERRLFRFLLSVLTGKPGLVRHFVNECQDFVTAGSVPELARKMNELTGDHSVDADLLEREIGRYDATIDRGKALWNDDQLRRIAHLRQWRGDRLRTSKFRKIVDPDAMPLIAIRLQILSRKSLGGIQTDLESRVLTPEGEPIPGLYAAGEAAGFGGGGVHGKRALEGSFLIGCVITARIAAEAIGERDAASAGTPQAAGQA